MATLNLSTNGPSITRSYQSVINSQAPSGRASSSPTYGQWAVFSVSAPLVNAFQQGSGGKESVLKVQSTGEGELVDLIDEFSDGRVQFALTKVKDPNTALPKNVLIGWCGEGVPERTKGYFTSHLAAVSKVLHGYHVQITARSDRDLTPDSIVRKVSDASGSKYSAGNTTDTSSDVGSQPPSTAKPAFMPTRVGGGGGSFNPLTDSRSKPSQQGGNLDEDGWGEDAPQVTRTQLEKVQSAYQPTKVNMSELTSQKQEPSRFTANNNRDGNERSDVVKGEYQPVGKVDIAALRRHAQESGSTMDDRPTTIKGSYEPVGKVDIAAIRAKAQRPQPDITSRPAPGSPTATGYSTRTEDREDAPKSVSDRSTAFTSSERLTTLPKPKVGNRFGSSTFTGTKAPAPGGFGQAQQQTSGMPPVGAASRTFADEGGKTPAQIWSEKKARERGLSGASENPPPSTPPVVSQQSGGGEWKSGYGGKSWAPVQTTVTGRSAGSSSNQHPTEQEEPHNDEVPPSPTRGIGAIRDRFKGAPPMGAPSLTKTPTGTEPSAPSPPPLNTSSKPNAGPAQARGIPIPGLPSRPAQRVEADEHDEHEQHHVPRVPSPPAQPRSPTPPTPPMGSGSPIRVAAPVARGRDNVEAPDERHAPPPMPNASLAKVVPNEEDLSEEPAGHDPARGAGEATAAGTFGQTAVDAAQPGAHESGKRALIQYDYEKAEENELELREGEFVTDIEMVDEDWWMGRNLRGETGLFPSNYVELEPEDDRAPISNEAAEAAPPAGPSSQAVGAVPQSKATGPVAVAIYDYQAAEDNELSFEEHDKITGIEFPDEDWWFGHHGGRSGLFPANYVQLEE